MGLNAKKTNSNSGLAKQDNIEADTYGARVVQLIDLGVQTRSPYKGEPKQPMQTLHITYELVECFCKDEEGNDILDKPRWISASFPFFPLTADKATSTLRYNAIDPTGVLDGEFTDLVNQPCDVIIINNPGSGTHAGKIFDNIADVVPMRKKDVQSCPELQNPAKVFILAEPDLDVFQSLPQWLQEKIKGALDYPTSPLAALLGGSTEAPEPASDDIPGQSAEMRLEKPDSIKEDNPY